MAVAAPTPSEEQAKFRARLLEAGILRATSVPGLYQRSGRYERIVRGVEGLASRAAAGRFEEPIFLPPIMPRDDFVRTDYLRSFPDLIGSIDIFAAGDKEHAQLLSLAEKEGDWTSTLVPAEVVLCSAACHMLYPTLEGTRLPEDGRWLDVQGFCFRHEPSFDPLRMQSFRMHELVRVASPHEALAHRDSWLERGLELLGSLGLPVDSALANDPFFGRAGRMLAANQLDTQLKFEIVCPVTSEEKPTAIASANYHMDHFGLPFGIRTADGEVAHSACFGFGLDRIALALLAHLGLDADGWPAATRAQLWP